MSPTLMRNAHHEAREPRSPRLVSIRHEPHSLAAAAGAPRWARLRGFVERWCAEPLEVSSAAIAEVVDAERRLGVRFPASVREWFAMTAHRLYDVNQDRPLPPTKIRVEDGRIALWMENQALDPDMGTRA